MVMGHFLCVPRFSKLRLGLPLLFHLTFQCPKLALRLKAIFLLSGRKIRAVLFPWPFQIMAKYTLPLSMGTDVHTVLFHLMVRSIFNYMI